MPATRPPSEYEDGGLCLTGESRCGLGKTVEVEPRLFDQFPVTQKKRYAIEGSRCPETREGFETFDGLRPDPLLLACLPDNGLGQGVLREGFHGGGDSEKTFFCDSGSRNDVGDAGLAHGERARLVEDDGGQLVGLLQAFARP